MVLRRRSPLPEIKQVEDLGDQTRNECQKAVLLREVGKMRCDEVSAAVETSKRILEASKKLCQNEDSARRRKAG